MDIFWAEEISAFATVVGIACFTLAVAIILYLTE